MESLAQAKHISEALHGIQHMLIGAEKIASNLWTLAMKGTSSQRPFVFSHSSSDCPADLGYQSCTIVAERNGEKTPK